MIFVQDAAESRMEGAEDSIGLFPGYSAILTQWIGTPPPLGGLTSLYNGYDFTWEWYRHNKSCQTTQELPDYLGGWPRVQNQIHRPEGRHRLSPLHRADSPETG
jgi:hypothetical protein